MSRIFMLAFACLMIGLPIASAVADTQVEKANFSVWIFSESAFNQNTKTDVDSTIALLPLKVGINDAHFASTTLEGMTFKVSYEKAKGTFVGIALDTTWHGMVDSTNYRITTDPLYDTIIVRLRGGTDTPPMQVLKTYLYLKFTPICRPEGSSVWLNLSSNAEKDNYVTLHGGSAFSPTSQYSGRVWIEDYMATFSMSNQTVARGTGDTIRVPVIGSTNSRIQSVTHQITFDHTKLTLVGSIYAPQWSTASATVDHDSLKISCSSNGPNGIAEMNAAAHNDTVYVLKFLPTCSMVESSVQLNFVAARSSYAVTQCASVNDQPSYTNATISMHDTAAYEAYLDAPTEVGYGVMDTVRYNAKIKNSFTAGVRSGSSKGVILAGKGYTYFRFHNKSALISGMTWGASQSTNRDTFVVWQDSSSTTKSITPSTSFLNLVAVDFEWAPANYTPDWGNKYIYPTFISNYSSDTTRVPSSACATLDAKGSNGLLRYGSFGDVVKIRMAQASSDGGSTQASCLTQHVRTRSNFAISRCSVWVHLAIPPVGAAGVGDTMTVTDLGANKYLISGTPNTTSDTLWVNVASFDISSACENPPYAATVTVDSSHFYSSGNVRQFGAPPITNTATIQCLYMCPPPGVPTDADGEQSSNLPKAFALRQNYPNPFNPTTTISLELPTSADWKITIYNIAGQVVKRFEGASAAGVVNVTWDASACASGIYLYKAEAGTFVETKKMLLIK